MVLDVLACWGDYPHCDENDKVEINWCDDSNDAQRWICKAKTEQYGRLSPAMNQTLCFELLEDSKRSLRLLPCDDNNRRQLFSGWNPSAKFELFPFDSSRCLSQEHDPKDFEEIMAIECETARLDHTNYFGIYNPSGEYIDPFEQMRTEDDSCIIDLDLMNDVAVTSGGAPFQSPSHPNIYLEQMPNGNLAVRHENTILWETGVNKTIGDYFTKNTATC